VEFWELIDEARAEVAHVAHWPSGMQVGETIRRRLGRLEPVQILEFDLWIRGQAAMADRWAFGAACYLFCGYVSEDGFGEFRYGLVGLGRTDFHAVLTDPDRGLSALPIVRAMAAGHASPFSIHGEQIQSAAADSYGERYWEDRAEIEFGPAATRFEPPDAPRIATSLPHLQGLFPTRVS
jgi:Protein of unknown function (DUF4240)